MPFSPWFASEKSGRLRAVELFRKRVALSILSYLAIAAASFRGRSPLLGASLSAPPLPPLTKLSRMVLQRAHVKNRRRVLSGAALYTGANDRVGRGIFWEKICGKMGSFRPAPGVAKQLRHALFAAAAHGRPCAICHTQNILQSNYGMRFLLWQRLVSHVRFIMLKNISLRFVTLKNIRCCNV